MRMWLLVGWLLLPALAAAWHYGPGQERMVLDDAQAILSKADAAAKAEDWETAESLYGDALGLLPSERVSESRRIRLERAKAQMLGHKLPEAHGDLQGLVSELTTDKTSDKKLLREARTALANARYYMTWLMRLEGEAPKEWEPEIDSARQTFKLLAEEAKSGGNQELASKFAEDLESSIRLARMDLSDLQGLPLPCQCQGCKSCNGRGKSKGKKSGKPSQQQDIRSAGAGSEIGTGGH